MGEDLRGGIMEYGVGQKQKDIPGSIKMGLELTEQEGESAEGMLVCSKLLVMILFISILGRNQFLFFSNFNG